MQAIDLSTKHKAEALTQVPQSPIDHHVLVVDDQQHILHLLRDVVQHLGYAVTISNNPTKALEQILDPHNHFSVVITDENMPNLLGHEMIARMREAGVQTPVLLLTGYGETLLEIGSKLENVRVLGKPIRFSELREVLDEVM